MGTKEEDYKEMFIAEALGNYEELNKLFTSLEKDIKDKKAINEIFRITHTLKGNAMGMGFEAIAELAHVMEDVFSEVKADKIELEDDLFNSLFKANDKLGMLIDAISSGEKVNYKGIRTKLTVFLKNAREERNGASTLDTTAENNEEISGYERLYADDLDKSNEETSELSLFDRIGGIEAVTAAVDIFYDKVINDESISHFFEGVDIKKQRAKQSAFLVYAFGGPVEYKGKDLQSAHAHLVQKGLNENHFNSVLHHLEKSLEELKVNQELIDEVIAIAKSVKEYVLGGYAEGVENPVDSNEEVKMISEEDIAVHDPEEEEETDDQPKISFSDLVQVPVRKLDNLMNLVGELIIERDSLVSTNARHGISSNLFARLQRITSDLQYGVMDVRLIQIGFLFNKFHRIVRDVAVIEDKKVDLVLEGTEIEIDRNVLKTMSDSLIHLVRNAVSHGIEAPEERIKSGKNERGKVTLCARNEKDTVIIDIKDDGNGIDAGAIARKAVKMGIVSQDFVDQASEESLIMLIFEPGFSNADKITEVSGRGVGMDVVKRATESIGGNIKVHTEIGKGSVISLSLPSSMAVKGALLFELNNQEYAVALSYTEAVVSLKKSDIHKVSNGLMAGYLGKTISIIFLNDLYDINNLGELNQKISLHKTYDTIKADQKLEVLITSYANKYVGFVVEKLLQQKEIVEKTLEPPVNNIDLISGATILGNGNVCLVLDIVNIVGTLFKDKN